MPCSMTFGTRGRRHQGRDGSAVAQTFGPASAVCARMKRGGGGGIAGANALSHGPLTSCHPQHTAEWGLSLRRPRRDLTGQRRRRGGGERGEEDGGSRGEKRGWKAGRGEERRAEQRGEK